MIYVQLAQFISSNTKRYGMISGDDSHPCVPFKLINRLDLSILRDILQLWAEMITLKHREFDESPELMEIISERKPVFCRSFALQLAMSKGVNYRKTFSIWNQGAVTVWDNRGIRWKGDFTISPAIKIKNGFAFNRMPSKVFNGRYIRTILNPLHQDGTTGPWGSLFLSEGNITGGTILFKEF